MSDVIQVADKIKQLINELEKAKFAFKKRGEKKAVTKAEYDRAVALTMLKLKNGVIKEFEGEAIDSVSYIETLAKGICWKEKLEMERAEAEYKSAITFIEVVTTQLQGYQSINKHLDNA